MSQSGRDLWDDIRRFKQQVVDHLNLVREVDIDSLPEEHKKLQRRITELERYAITIDKQKKVIKVLDELIADSVIKSFGKIDLSDN